MIVLGIVFAVLGIIFGVNCIITESIAYNQIYGVLGVITLGIAIFAEYHLSEHIVCDYKWFNTIITIPLFTSFIIVLNIIVGWSIFSTLGIIAILCSINTLILLITGVFMVKLPVSSDYIERAHRKVKIFSGILICITGIVLFYLKYILL